MSLTICRNCIGKAWPSRSALPVSRWGRSDLRPAPSYTIVTVAHNMQQDAQVSEGTAFRYPVRLDEFDAQEKISAALAQQRSQDYITGQSG